MTFSVIWRKEIPWSCQKDHSEFSCKCWL